jgi:hypothetical protein
MVMKWCVDYIFTTGKGANIWLDDEHGRAILVSKIDDEYTINRTFSSDSNGQHDALTKEEQEFIDGVWAYYMLTGEKRNIPLEFCKEG